MKLHHAIVYTTVFILVVSTCIPFCHAASDDESFGQYAIFLLDINGKALTERNLFSTLLSCSFDSSDNDWNTRCSIQEWIPNAHIMLLENSYPTRNDGRHEEYSFSFDINDAFIFRSFLVSFDCYLTDGYEGNIVVDCRIEPISSGTNVLNGRWESEETTSCYFKIDVRPDGQIGIEGHYYYTIKSTDPWESYYKTVSWDPVEDQWNNQAYGYEVNLHHVYKIMLYPNGTIFDSYYNRMFYPVGIQTTTEGSDIADIETTTTNYSGEVYLNNSCGDNILASDSNEIALVDYEASSELTDQYGSYTVSNCFDGNRKTTWAEAESGDGIGSSISGYWMVVSGEWEITGVAIWAGYHKSSDVFYKNNRPHSITLEVRAGSELESFDIDLADSESCQYIIFDSPLPFSYHAQLEVIVNSVYNGNKYSDTCITDIDLLVQRR